MKVSGNIRKMRTELGDVVQYTLPLFDVLNENEWVPMNGFIGKIISIKHNGVINCVVTGKRIKKAYEEHDNNMYSISADPISDEISSDPRFLKILKDMKLPMPK